MEIMVTAPGRQGVRHLVVRAPDGTSVADLHARVHAPTGPEQQAVAPGPEQEPVTPASGPSPPLLHGHQLSAPAAARPSEGGTSMASVVVSSGPDSGRWVELRPGRWVTIGRDASCDLTVEDPTMSRVHLRVRHERDRFLLQDLGSTNGVRPEERAAERTEEQSRRSPDHWVPGSTLVAGTTRLSLVSEAAAPLALTPSSGRLTAHPWPRSEPELRPLELSTPPVPQRRVVRPPSAWTWALPLVIGVGVALVLRMPWLMLFGLLGPAMVIGQYLGDRRSARLEHREALQEHASACAGLEHRRQRALRSELDLRRRRDPGVAGVRAALVPVPTVHLWSRADEPPRLVIGEGTATSLVTTDGVPAQLEDAPVVLGLDQPLAVVGPPVVRDAAVRSWLLQLATSHPPSRLAIVVDPEAPPTGWDLLAWLPHTVSVSEPLPDGRQSLVWGRDLVLVEDVRAAPRGMARVVVHGREHAVLQRPGKDDLAFVPTLLSHPTARSFARRLAPLTDGTTHRGGTPAAATLGDLLPWPTTPGEAGRRWDGPTALSVPIGTDPHGAPVHLDLSADGPHALVAGTTGSGKSELLRTLVVGLALRNAPDRLSFLLIDYKGGSSLGECAALPHSTGLVTDLDPHLAQRVLVSLQSELRRREAELARSGARDVRDYAGSALPRLVVVIDEFRVLKEELPAFLDGLIRVAAVGRSLGLHLVLATQRPAGVITADLRANVNLRIALRLRDAADSHDVIEAADAALLPEGRPGAALIRTGSAPPRRVQVVPAAPGEGERAPETWSVEDVRDVWAGFRALHGGPDAASHPATESALSHLPGLLRGAADARGMQPRPVWLPALPEYISAGDGVVADPSVWALADRPERQDRQELRWDAGSSIGVVGAAGTGRSTALAALVRSAGPVWLYVLDLGRGLAGSGLDGHPGLRAWVGPDEVAQGLRVLDVLSAEIDARRARPEEEHGRLVVVLDGWDRWVEQAGQVEGGRGVDLALRLLREGRAVWVSCAVSGDRSLLLGKLAAVLPETWALRLNDPSELTLNGLRRDQLPVDPPPGRAVRLTDGLVAQVVLGPAGPTHPGVAPTGPAPPVVRALPTRLADTSSWAVGGDAAEPLPDIEGSVLVLGPPRSGVSSTLHRLARSGDALVPGAVARPGRAEPGPPHTDGVQLVQGENEERVLLVPGPGAWSDAALAAALEGGPSTVVVDEAHLLLGSTTEDLVLDWARRTGGRLLVGGELEACSGQFRGLVPHLARHRRGIILQPSAPRDGHVLGVTLPVGDVRVPGRGVLVDRGRTTRIQVAAPATAPELPGGKQSP